VNGRPQVWGQYWGHVNRPLHAWELIPDQAGTAVINHSQHRDIDYLVWAPSRDYNHVYRDYRKPGILTGLRRLSDHLKNEMGHRRGNTARGDLY